MERKYLITHEGNFYKANLHSHSTFSDGVLTPEQAKELYKSTATASTPTQTMSSSTTTGS